MSLLIGPDTTFTRMGNFLANRAGYYISNDGKYSLNDEAALNGDFWPKTVFLKIVLLGEYTMLEALIRDT